MKILIAEDEKYIAKALKVLLEKNKHTVDMVHTGNDAWDYLSTHHYDVAVLDIMMPGMDGIEVLKKARSSGIVVPTLFLTAKGEVEDRVAGLEAGADDYLTKPFATSEFLARVHALARRREQFISPVMSFGNVQLDSSRYIVSVGDKSARLNNKEFQLLELFMRHPHQVFSSEILMDRVWGADTEAGLDVVWTYIGFIRKKLRQLGADIGIRTVRGAGYALEDGPC